MKESINQPLVSIVVLTYNLSMYVLDTLESCKNQTYDNIELIITDDASTDNTISVVNNWLNNNQDRFVNIKIIQAKRNTGVSGNFNRGLKAVSSKWFKPISGDDVLLENCIQDNVNKISKISDSSVSVIYSRKINFKNLTDYNNLDSKEDNKKNEKIDWFYITPDITAEDQFELALRRISPAIVSWFIKKKSALEVGGADEGIAMQEDGTLLFRLLLSGHKFCLLDKKTVLYRKHPESITQKNKGEKIYKDWTINYYFRTVKKYIYPNVSLLEKAIINLDIFIANMTIKLGVNKRTTLNLLINKILCLPLFYLKKTNEKSTQDKIKKKYA